ncbi:MAG: MFS transporter [Thermoplasmata archaeon]|nr:MFS transporter [Thermoplasmata archaeon]
MPVLRSAGFRFLLGSSIASAVGGAASSVAVNWLVYRYTGSTLDVAYVGLTGILPGIALGLFAGVFADRYDRRRIMIVSDAVRLLVMGLLAAALLFTGFSLLVVIAAMTLVYSFSALFAPASQAILPRIVPAGQLESANGLLAALTQLGFTVGAGAGGLLVVLAGAVIGVGLNAATYGLSAVLLLQVAASVGRPDPRPSGSQRSFRSDLAEGVAYMRSHRPVLEVTLGFMPANFLLTMVASFFVVYSSAVYGSDAAVYGSIVAAMAAGAVVGALVVAPLRARRFAGVAMGLSVVAQAGGVGLMVIGRSVPLSVGGAAVIGLSIGFITTVYYSTMQSIVPNTVLARVLSIDTVGSFVAIPGGLVVGGFLAASYGILTVYAIAAIGLLANGLGVLALPGFRSVRYEPGRSAYP